MPLHIVRNDITRMTTDAIVNAANESLLGGGGVDGAIHKAAGPELLEYCKTLGGCKVGQAKITPAYNLPSKWIIHTVGPIWSGGSNNEKNLLESCYINSLVIAKQNNLESIAFPLISAGVYGYPVNQAYKVAIDTIGDWLMNNEMTVYLVIYDSKALTSAIRISPAIKEYIDDNYVKERASFFSRLRGSNKSAVRDIYSNADFAPMYSAEPLQSAPAPVACEARMAPKMSEADLAKALDSVDESFTQSLLRQIDNKGMKDSECYKLANVDRKLFSKIRSDIYYKPKKTTALAFAIALELSLEETEAFIKKAGFALSSSSKADIIVKYYIENKCYKINDINATLFAYDQPILGSL